MHQLVTFELFGELFALPILDVREIIRLQPITPVPSSPSFVEGVISLRGQILPIVDLRKRFGLPPEATTPKSRILVVEAGTDLTLGLIVDAARQVERIPAEAMLPPPALLEDTIGAHSIRGISNTESGMLVHLDLQRIFAPEEKAALISH
jgi:purine-binding chemotaxis protein CheW